ncbi:MAG: helix-turn-helix domain-containing protein [Verrucomicrobia bacterium]|nr:helix-turn-helix domain-containing protein [Verrucomicrobiota bacterium]
MLIASNRTVDDIADGSGFASSRAFFKQFKRLTRLTPAEFRRQHSARR